MKKTDDVYQSIDKRITLCEAHVRDAIKSQDMIVSLYEKDINDLKMRNQSLFSDYMSLESYVSSIKDKYDNLSKIMNIYCIFNISLNIINILLYLRYYL